MAVYNPSSSGQRLFTAFHYHCPYFAGRRAGLHALQRPQRYSQRPVGLFGAYYEKHLHRVPPSASGQARWRRKLAHVFIAVLTSHSSPARFAALLFSFSPADPGAVFAAAFDFPLLRAKATAVLQLPYCVFSMTIRTALPSK